MQKQRLSRTQKAVRALYGVLVLLFLGYFIYIGLTENITVYSARSQRGFAPVTGLVMETEEDAGSPVGVRQVYRWRIAEDQAEGQVMSCYLVHQCIEVWLDDELVYSLEPEEGNVFSNSVSSNWITVPLYPTDAGRELTAIVTPLYTAVMERKVSFLIGSERAMLVFHLRRDFPQMLLAALCVLLGGYILFSHAQTRLRGRRQEPDILYLGLLMLLLGIWRITDTRISTWLFPRNPLLLGYVAIGVMFLSGVPLVMFIHHRFAREYKRSFGCLALFNGLAALTLLALQVLRVADFRETLPLGHVVLVLDVAVMLGLLVHYRIRVGKILHSRSWLYILMLMACLLLDLILYYTRKSSASVVFTLLGMIIYTLCLLMTSIAQTHAKAYRDDLTGLYNKRRWEELMEAGMADAGSVSMLVMDLNQLKHINDTLGHEAGNQLIFTFANILRNVLPPSSVICRWGGDEFAALIPGAPDAEPEQYMGSIRKAVESYNQSSQSFRIEYAIGGVVSREYPDMSLRELFNVADHRMYQNKAEWYAKRS